MTSKGPTQPRTGATGRQRMHPRARQQRLEMGAGIFGFFTLVFFVDTLVAEIRGEDALGPALFLLGFAVLFGLMLQKRWGIFTRR